MKALHRFSFFLAPNVLQAALSVAVLPVSTFFLGPADFGLFALLSSITGLISVLATLGSSYLLARHYPIVDEGERIKLISSLTWIGLLVGVLSGALVLAAWPFIARMTFEWNPEQSWLAAIAVAAMLLSLPWAIAGDVIRLAGRARVYAAAMIGQSLASALALLLCLLAFERGVESLFIASISGAVVLFAGALYTLAPYLRAVADRHYAIELFSVARRFLLSSMAEALHQVLERAMLTARGGLGQLGLYSHSQMYRAAAAMPVSAVSDTAWATTLAEARADRGDFTRTGMAWRAAHLWLTAAGLLLAALGSHLISLLTHDKFTEAHAVAALWAIYLLVQNSGKPQTALFYAHGHGVTYALIQGGAMVCGTALLFVLIPPFGMYGAFVAALAQQLLMRTGVQLRARRIKPSPFQDGPALAGTVLIAATLAVKVSFGGDVATDVAILGVALSVFAVLGRTTAIELWRRVR